MFLFYSHALVVLSQDKLVAAVVEETDSRFIWYSLISVAYTYQYFNLASSLATDKDD